MTFISSLHGVALLLSIFKLNQVKSNVGSCGVGKPDDPGENLSEQGREPTNSTHITPRPEIARRPHWLKARAVTTAPTLLSQ